MSGGMLPSITSHMQRLRSTHDPPACNKIWKLNEIGLEAFLKGLDSISEHEADEVVLLPVPPPTYKGKGKEKLSDMPEFPRQFPNGKTTELFHYRIAAIMSMGYEKRQSVTLLALGGFFVNVVVQQVNPLLKITVCSINQFQWPLTKDTPIIRMGQRTFFFAFPGLLYALQFPRVCGPTIVAYLVRLFKIFSYYQDFADVSTAGSVASYPCSDNEPSLWNIVRPLAEPMAHEILLLFGHRPGLSRFYVSNHNSSYTRAIRLSATTRTIMEAFVSGSLTLSCITIQDSYNEPPCIPAHASITVFTCLVDALEASTLVSHGFKTIPLLDSCNNACYPSPGFRVWRLNDVGVINFLRGLDATVKNEEECVLSKTVEESSSDEKKGEEVTSNVDDKGKGKQVMP
ncbi:uncharacterized protein G2W53_008284 [Senna tora]|uniref:Uncharacterized protein n=1 Tax=Senna tora TaxID=362788 RepID=A0A834X8F2_9FABA|nr:uncharacterized protein G2W53_008284 [Senna tora]